MSWWEFRGFWGILQRSQALFVTKRSSENSELSLQISAYSNIYHPNKNTSYLHHGTSIENTTQIYGIINRDIKKKNIVSSRKNLSSYKISYHIKYIKCNA